MSDHASLTPAKRFALIIQGLCFVVAKCGGRAGLGDWNPGPRLAAPLVKLIWTYLKRVDLRFARILATPYRPAKPRPACPRPCKPSPPPAAPLPRGKTWLRRLIPQTSDGASQLRYFLEQPDVILLLQADPRLGRLFRPLCRMLQIRPPEIIKRPPPKPALETTAKPASPVIFAPVRPEAAMATAPSPLAGGPPPQSPSGSAPLPAFSFFTA